jgi:2-hydroxychromene-2-carboxylate isomerase
MNKAVDFFFFYGSLHSYLSVLRIGKLASAAGVSVRWRPFNLREILIEQNNTGFVKNPIKMSYFWRDIERRAEKLGIEFRGPAPYPADPDLSALRAGLVAAQQGWCQSYSVATFRAWFLDQHPPGRDNNVTEILTGLGKPANAILSLAGSGEVSDLLKTETQAARELGIFGSPSFAVGKEIFWGDDRLEDAMAFASR